MKTTLLAFALALTPPAPQPAVSPVDTKAGSPSGIVKVKPPVLPPWTVTITTKPKLVDKSGSEWNVSGSKPKGFKWTIRDKNTATFTLPPDTQPCVIEGTWVGHEYETGKQYTWDWTATIGPSPVPVPPVPDDPEYQKIQAAYLSDSPLDPMQRKNAALNLIKYYREATGVCRASVATDAGSFFQQISAINSDDSIKAMLPKVRQIVHGQLDVVFPPPTLATTPSRTFNARRSPTCSSGTPTSSKAWW
jgi:hypothetical protein